MKHILSRTNVDVLAQLAWTKVLLAFDFDGTLAPIVEDRDKAFMRAPTRRLVTKLCALYPCAVISGRSQSDVGARVDGVGVKYVMGNHGLEPGTGMRAFAREISEAHRLLASVLGGLPGLDMEDKRYSLAVHYRRSRRKRDARDAIHAAVAKLPMQMRLIPGKMVVNVVPDRAPNKGDALLHLRNVEHAATALYVGDDFTDEDVFKLDQPGRLLTIRIGNSRTSSAEYFLRTQQEIDTLLGKLVSLRESRAIQ